MKRFLTTILIGCGALSLSFAANAQTWGRDPYNNRNDRPYDNRGYDRRQQSPVDQVMSDLNRAAGRARLDGHERKHFEQAMRSLQEFQERWARGRFDNGKLDKAIDNLEHLAQADRVRGFDRNLLARDLNDLRQFRATGGRYNDNPRYGWDW